MRRSKQIALLLQGGGALASYQGGVYQALAQADLHPDWLVGISSGALNAAIIAGNPPKKRLDKLRAFWDSISQPRATYPGPLSAWMTFAFGQKGFFKPKWTPTYFQKYTGEGIESWYDASPMQETLTRFADFDRINDSRKIRVSLGAVNIRSGECEYFDNTRTYLRPEHFLASCALPPGFPAVEIDGEFYWDAGAISNTPLECLMYGRSAIETVAINVDLWCMRGIVPSDSVNIESITQDINYLSKTQIILSSINKEEQSTSMMRDLLALVPEGHRENKAYIDALNHIKHSKVRIIPVQYKNKPCHSHYKAYDFSKQKIDLHWQNGFRRMKNILETQMATQL